VRLIEVSHRIVPGMKTYPGLPEPKVDVIVDYETSRERYGGKAEFFIASLHLCGNTGTYVDSPHHRYPMGQDLADLPLERVAHVPAVVIDATGAGVPSWVQAGFDAPPTIVVESVIGGAFFSCAAAGANGTATSATAQANRSKGRILVSFARENACM